MSLQQRDPQKIWGWIGHPEVQHAAGRYSKLGQVAQTFAKYILKNPKAGGFTASPGKLFQISGTPFAVFILLTASTNFLCSNS